jgi:ABC-2 type transport system ATP-binding protein
MSEPAIRTANLGRTFPLSRKKGQSAPDASRGNVFVALDGVSLEIQPGELFGLLGSNGAGKTTLIRILTTLLAPTSGSAWVDGLDVNTSAPAIRERINMVCGGETSGYGILTVQENLWLFSQLYGVPSRVARARIDEMLAIVGLTEWANKRISHLSTGMRQKMNFCRGFITDPRILFLDEPTLGLDVPTARALRQFLKRWMSERPGRTMVLTTHYMLEADTLCDRIAIIDQGKVLACDTPGPLKRSTQRYPIFELALAPGINGWHGLAEIPGVHQVTSTEGADAVQLKLALHEEGVIGAVVQEIVRGGGRILALKKVEPTLEDAFVELVGHRLQVEEVQR